MQAAISAPRWTNPRLEGRLPELDGVRGLAILLVLIWHYFICTIPVAVGTLPSYLLACFRLTWSGVDLFFVLSGFLIGGILFDAKELDGYYGTFYLRRVHRIFPLYFIVIATFLAGLYLVRNSSSEPLRELFNQQLPAWCYPLFLQNFFMSWHRDFGAKWMGATWSLAVEEQFYLLLPFLVRVLDRRKIIMVGLTSVAAALVVRGALSRSGNTLFGPYTLLPCRADALALGLLVALACRDKRTWDWIASHRPHLYWVFAILGLGMVYLTVSQRGVYVFGLSWIAAFYATLLLLTLVNPSRIESTIFRAGLLRSLGTVAYGLYLFHQGINELCHLAVFGKRPAITGWSSLGVTLLALLIVLLLCAISWRMLEKPLIRRGRSKYRYQMSPGRQAASSAS